MQFGFEDDLKAAMKAGDKRKVSTLRLLIAALKNERIQAGHDLVHLRQIARIKAALQELARGR